MGIFVNDSKEGANTSMQKVVIDAKPYLCLFALKDIEEGEELRYNYNAPNLSWRKKVITIIVLQFFQ